MNVSHATVHPVEDPPTTEAGNVPRARIKDIQGMPATLGGLVLRFCQFFFAAAALCVMATTSDFPSVTAFRYLVAATGLQSIWSFSLVLTDGYALLITSTLTFAAACASAGITVLIDNDIGSCNQNHCLQFESSTGMAYISWFLALPSFLFNFWSLASR